MSPMLFILLGQLLIAVWAFAVLVVVGLCQFLWALALWTRSAWRAWRLRRRIAESPTPLV